MSDVSATAGARGAQGVAPKPEEERLSPSMRYFALAMDRASLLEVEVQRKGDMYEQQLKDMKNLRHSIDYMRNQKKNGQADMWDQTTYDTLRDTGTGVWGTWKDGAYRGVDWDTNIQAAETKLKDLTSDNVQFDTEFKQLVTKHGEAISSAAAYVKQTHQVMRDVMPS